MKPFIALCAFTFSASLFCVLHRPAEAARFRRSGGYNGTATHSASPSPAVKTERPQPATPFIPEKTEYASKVEWSEEGLIYEDTQGNRWYAENVYIADSDGTRPQADKTLAFKKGDILFKVASTPQEVWYKADGKTHSREPLRSDNPLYKDLPLEIKHFINVYARERPEMQFDLRLYKVAQERAPEVSQQQPHVADINRRIWNAGYRTPEPQGANTSESVWGARDAEGALNGWRSSKGHRNHVWGLASWTKDHRYYGVGFQKSRGQWVILTAPAEIP